MIFDICCLGNPGVIQVFVKELLMDVKTIKAVLSQKAILLQERTLLVFMAILIQF